MKFGTLKKKVTVSKEYVKDFMKIKLKTSPCENDFSTIQNYIVPIKSCLNIDLDPKNVAPNPGKRAVAKICLNSLCCKFGQRQNDTEYVSDVKRWYHILMDDKLEISNTINDNMVQVTFRYKNHSVQDTFSTSVYIAAFTTSNARLRLYDMLDKLGQSVAYYDTDSIVYIDNGENAIKTGCMLDEWSGVLPLLPQYVSMSWIGRALLSPLEVTNQLVVLRYSSYLKLNRFSRCGGPFGRADTAASD